MPLSPSHRLGTYEIAAQIGAGGMGEVYRARDSKLNRFVAIKILPPAFATDADRLRRFELEAQTAGGLNHPNIVTVYDFGRHDQSVYVVTELLEGETLRDRLTSPVPAKRTIDYAVQAARGLAAAHAKGITHRDIKPENLFLTSDGFVKILDFGLAKVAAAKPLEKTSAPTTPMETDPGVVMGTAAYMSPEQVRGAAVDPRSDIFSLGAVIYEMLAGKRAFIGDSSVEVMSAILREDPPALPDSVPAEIDRIVHRCLEKRPEQRFQSALDLAFALDSTSTTTSRETLVASGRRIRRQWSPYAIAAAGVMAGAAIAWLWPAPETPIYNITPLTAFEGIERDPALSPDGTQLAFSWVGQPPGNPGIYVQLIGSGTQPLRVSPSDRSARYPAWSPDGKRIAYLAGDHGVFELMEVPALGGPERRIARDPAFVNAAIAWSPDGKFIALATGSPSTSSLERISIETSERRKLTTAQPGARDLSPHYSPDGRLLAFVHNTGVFSSSPYVLRLNPGGDLEGPPRRIGNRTWYTLALDWFPDSRSIVFPSIEGGRELFYKTNIDGSGLKRLSWEYPVDGTVPLGPSQSMVSLRGSRLAAVLFTTSSEIGKLGRDGADRWNKEPFYLSSHSDYELQIAPNQKSVVFSSTRSGSFELWRSAPDGSGALQLTSLGIRLGSPRWSPDNEWIVFDGPHGDDEGIYIVSSQGGRVRYLTEGARPSFARDGKSVYFMKQGDIWRTPTEGSQPRLIVKGGTDSFDPGEGPWIYFGRRAAAGSATGGGIYRAPLNGGAEELVVSDSDAISWGLTKNAVYLGLRHSADSAEIVRFDVASKQKTLIYRFPTNYGAYNFSSSLAIAPDEKTIYYMGRKQNDADIMLIEPVR